MFAERIMLTPVSRLEADGENMQVQMFARLMHGLVNDEATRSSLETIQPPNVLTRYGHSLEESLLGLQKERSLMLRDEGQLPPHIADPQLRSYLVTEVPESLLPVIDGLGTLVGKATIDYRLELGRRASNTLEQLKAWVIGEEVRLSGRSANISVWLNPTVHNYPYKLAHLLYSLCQSVPVATTLWNILPAEHSQSNQAYWQALEANDFRIIDTGPYYYRNAENGERSEIENVPVEEYALFMRSTSFAKST